MMGYFGDENITSDNAIAPARNYYPDAGGATLGTIASSASPDTVATTTGAGGAGRVTTGTRINDPSVGGRPVAWWIGLVIVVAVIFYTARKTGNEGEFSNIRASTFNIVMITFIAILGITLGKIAAAKFANVRGLSGLSSIIMAA